MVGGVLGRPARVKGACARRVAAVPGGGRRPPAATRAPRSPPPPPLGTNQTPGGTKDVKNKVKNTHTRNLAPPPPSRSPPMSNVSAPPGEGGRLKITRCLHLEQILGFASSQAKASACLPGSPIGVGGGCWGGGSQGATCAHGLSAHVWPQEGTRPRKPSAATRWMEAAEARSIPPARDGVGAPGRPARGCRGARPLPASLPSEVSPAASPTRQPRGSRVGGGVGGRPEAGSQAREAGTKGRAPEQGRVRTRAVCPRASPAPLWAKMGSLPVLPGGVSGEPACLVPQFPSLQKVGFELAGRSALQRGSEIRRGSPQVSRQ